MAVGMVSIDVIKIIGKHTLGYGNFLFNFDDKTISLGNTIIDRKNFKQHIEGQEYKGLRLLYALIRVLNINNSDVDFNREIENGFIIPIRSKRMEINSYYKECKDVFEYLPMRKSRGWRTMDKTIDAIPYLNDIIKKFNLDISINRMIECKPEQGDKKEYILFSTKHLDIVKENFKQWIIKER